MDQRLPVRSIIEDLLPLYHDGLLNKETTDWLERQLDQNKELQHLVDLSKQSLKKEKIEPTIHQDSAFKAIQRKLSLYQMIFVALSFLLAVNTSILNESFGFILSYTILGLITYFFYKDIRLVLSLSFIPIFIWFLGDSMIQLIRGEIQLDITLAEYVLHTFLGGIFMTGIHAVFALIGSLVALLVIKLREENSE